LQVNLKSDILSQNSNIFSHKSDYRLIVCLTRTSYPAAFMLVAVCNFS